MPYQAEKSEIGWLAGRVLADDLYVIGETLETGEGPVDTSEENNLLFFFR